MPALPEARARAAPVADAKRPDGIHGRGAAHRAHGVGRARPQHAGSGDEERMSLVFSVPEDVASTLNNWSESFQLQLEGVSPDLAKKWHSSIKPATDKYPAQLRTKLNVKGDKACKCYDMEGEYTSLPQQWRGLEVSAIIRFGGVYVQKANAGMLFEVTALQFDPSVSREQNPFA